MYIIVTQIIALICDTYLAFAKTSKRVYTANTLFNIFAGLTSLLQKDYGTALSYSIILYRSISLLYKDKLKEKYKWFPLTFVLAHIIFGICTWKDMWSIIPIAMPIILGLSMWYTNNVQKYRLVMALNNFSWFIRDIHAGSYILSLARVYGLCMCVISYLKDRVLHKRK